MGDVRSFLVDKFGRVRVLECPYDLFRTCELSDLQLRMFHEMKMHFAFSSRKLKIDGRERTIKRGQCFFQVKVFARAFGYPEVTTRRAFRQMTYLGFWEIEKLRTGAIVTEKAFHEIPQLKAAQLRVVAPKNDSVSMEKERKRQLEMLAAQNSLTPELAPGLALQAFVNSPLISNAYPDENNTCNATGDARNDGEHLYLNTLPNNEHCVTIEDRVTEENFEGDALSALLNAALDGPLVASKAPAATSGNEMRPPASQATSESLRTGEGASSAAGDRGLEFLNEDLSFREHLMRIASRRESNAEQQSKVL